MSDGGREFQELHRTFRPKILRYLTRLVGDEAKDLTQEVFLKVSRSLKDFRGQSQPSTWIYRIATNVALDRMRSPSFRRIAPTDMSRIAAGENTTDVEDKNLRAGQELPSVETALIREEMMTCLGQVIEKLPENYRTVVVSSILAGMKNREIARALGISLETVKIRLHRGRSLLKKELERRCGFYRDARNGLRWDGTIK